MQQKFPEYRKITIISLLGKNALPKISPQISDADIIPIISPAEHMPMDCWG